MDNNELGTNLAAVGTDCISRQAAIDYFVTNVGFHDEDGYPIEDTDELRKIWTEYFSGIPSAEPKRGRWIEDKGQQTLMKNFIEMGEVWRVCSVCGAGHMIGHKYECDKAYHEMHHNFCPNCGADMRGEKE